LEFKLPSFDDLFAKVSKSLANDPGASIKEAGDITLSSRIPYGIPTGIPELELAIGRPGIPAATITEFYGFERAGKTTAALHVLASAQRAGGGGLFIDAESTFDRERAIQLGVDPEKNFRIGEVENIEGIFRLLLQTLDHLETVQLKSPFVFVIDSVTGVESEINDDAKKFGKEARVGQDARLIRRGVRLAHKKIANTKAAVIFINHAIATIDGAMFGPKSQAAGGHSLKLLSTLRVQFSKGADLQDKKVDDQLRLRHGQKSFIKVEKLKSSKLVFQNFEIDLKDDGGFDTVASLLRAGVHTGWITKPDTKSFKLGEQDFPERDWPAVVTSLGGKTVMYDQWLKWCIANGHLQHWANWNGA